MWAIVKFDKKKFDFFKRELRTKLGHNHILYSPKILINKYKNNKLIKKEFSVLGDYVFLYDKKLQDKEILAKLQFVKGLKNILSGFLFYQKEIVKFINRCKEFENDSGYITQNFFDIQEVSKYKFMSGPFVNQIFQITNIQHNKIRILIGDLKTTIKKKEFLFNRI